IERDAWTDERFDVAQLILDGGYLRQFGLRGPQCLFDIYHSLSHRWELLADLLEGFVRLSVAARHSFGLRLNFTQLILLILDCGFCVISGFGYVRKVPVSN